MTSYRMPNPRVQQPSCFEVDEDLLPRSNRLSFGRRPLRYRVAAVDGRHEFAAVRIDDVVVDGRDQWPLYDRFQLASTLRALSSGEPLPALAVIRRPDGLHQLDEDFHRFLACVIVGIGTVPVAYPTSWLPRYRCA